MCYLTVNLRQFNYRKKLLRSLEFLIPSPLRIQFIIKYQNPAPYRLKILHILLKSQETQSSIFSFKYSNPDPVFTQLLNLNLMKTTGNPLCVQL